MYGQNSISSGLQPSTDRDTGIASLIPDASLASLIPIQIGTLHAQVCKFGHQWKCSKFRNYAIIQSHKFTGFRRCHQRNPLFTSPQIPQSSVDLADYSAVCAS